MLEDLLNRLRKRSQHLRRWAKRESLTAWRIYDRDIPEHPYAIDWYDGSLVVYHYTKERIEKTCNDEVKPSFDPELSGELVPALSSLFSVPEADIFLKWRAKRAREAQYTELARTNATKVVTERGMRFQVNLSDFVDTGLFLDSRELRHLILKNSAGKRVLNLFSYTGTASVAAHCGDARRVVSVDLSNRALSWTRENFTLNGVEARDQDLVRGDAMQVLRELRARRETFELIFVDPPSFSNSKAMQGTFDVQRDHAMLLQLCSEILSPAGTILFCNNLKRFKMDPALLPNWERENISHQTIPEDFRNERIHNSWLLRRTPDPAWRNL